MAARGYWQAFQTVKASIKEILGGKNSGSVTDKDHGKWYRELFSPSVTTGIIVTSELAGYRNEPVYIKGSRHTPPSPAAIKDAMPALFEILKEEKEPSVRAVLGHFIFVYLHPYRDGNGRIGRFLMNVMLASGGYPWTVISLANRKKYMEALEKASVEQDISAFVEFLAKLVKEGLEGKSIQNIPDE
jgi:Fic family protein